MDDLTWDDSANDEALHDTSDGEADAWENLDFDPVITSAEEEQEQREKDSKTQLRREIEELKRQNRELKDRNAQLKEGGAAEGAAPKRKVQSKMMARYEVSRADREAAEDLMGGGDAHGLRIDLLQPQTEKEFGEFTGLVVEKLMEFHDSPHYAGMVKDLVTRCMGALSSGAAFDIKKAVDKTKEDILEREKEAKRAGTKKVVKTFAVLKDKGDVDVLDQIAMGGSAPPDSNGTFDDDDFM